MVVLGMLPRLQKGSAAVINLQFHSVKLTCGSLNPTGLFKHFSHASFTMSMILSTNSRRWWWATAGGMEKLLFLCFSLLSWCMVHQVACLGTSSGVLPQSCAQKGNSLGIPQTWQGPGMTLLWPSEYNNAWFRTHGQISTPSACHPPASAHLRQRASFPDNSSILCATASPSPRRSGPRFQGCISVLGLL